MYYIDSHCHIYNGFFSNVEKYIIDSVNNNVNKIITCGDDYNTCLEVVELSKKYNNVFYSLGYHPEYIDKIEKDDISKLEELIKISNPIAIGEVGLDYHYDEFDKEAQIKLLKQMLFLAQKYNLPVIIHSREANQDMINILREYNLKGVFHSFDGTLEEAKEIIDLGFYIGVNGIITFKNAEEKRYVIKNIPLEKILLETDSPFLSPEPFRGQQNESKNIPYISKKLAEIKGLDEEKVMIQTTKNVEQLFELN